MKNIRDFLDKYQFWFFAGIVLFFCQVFFAWRHFPTLDGPAHLYNSNLINALFFHSQENINSYYEFNSVIVPNWMGHFFLSLLNGIFPADMAEKIFLTGFVLSFTLAFRYLVLSFQKNNSWLALLSIPFAFNTFLFFGFFNFCISFVFVFLALGYIKRNENNLSAKKIPMLLLLFSLVWFSHITIFVFLLLLITCYFICGFLIEKQQTTWKKHFNFFFRQSLILLLAALPGIALTLIYKQAYGEQNHFAYIDPAEIKSFFKNIQALVVFTTEEAKFTYFFLLFFVLAGITLLVLRVIKKPLRKFQRPDVFLVLAVITCWLTFVLPDSDSKGGYITLRMILLFYILLLCWINFQEWNVSIQIILSGFLLCVHFYHASFRQNIHSHSAKLASEIYIASNELQDGDVVLVVNQSPDWFINHQSNYLGADKKVVILENYEAIQDYFPLRWKPSTKVPAQGSTSGETACNEYLPYVNQQYSGINHVFFVHDPAQTPLSCDSILNQSLTMHYELKYSSQFCSLYGLKAN